MTAAFHEKWLGDILGKVWWPEVGRTLRGTFYGSRDKQDSSRAWVTLDWQECHSPRLCRQNVLFAILRQPNRLEALGASGIICGLQIAVTLPSASFWQTCASTDQRALDGL